MCRAVVRPIRASFSQELALSGAASEPMQPQNGLSLGAHLINLPWTGHQFEKKMIFTLNPGRCKGPHQRSESTAPGHPSVPRAWASPPEVESGWKSTSMLSGEFNRWSISTISDSYSARGSTFYRISFFPVLGKRSFQAPRRVQALRSN